MSSRDRSWRLEWSFEVFFLANSLNWGVHSVDCDFIAGDFCIDFKSLNVDMNWNKLFWSNVACHLIWFYSMLLEICNKAGQWCLWPVCSSPCLVLGMGLEHGGKHRPWMPRWLVTPSYILVSMKPVTCLWMCSLNPLFLSSILTCFFPLLFSLLEDSLWTFAAASNITETPC